MTRSAVILRKTAETRIRVELGLDGSATRHVDTGIAFYDHMLDQVARHGLFDLRVEAEGDLHVDAHHTVEDVAIALGQAFNRALADRAGISRFGSARVPLDEALSEVTLDLGGRPYLVFHPGPLDGRRGEILGGLPVDLVDHFFQSFAVAARAAVHVEVCYGDNLHHCVEATFKAFARALKAAVAVEPGHPGVPSTKGTLSA